MIELINVSKQYNQKGVKQNALNNVSISFPNNGLIAILGDSGSGKTTLLNCIGGIESFKGTIKTNNFSFSKENNHLNEFRKKNIGYVFQDFCLLETMTVYENLQLTIDIANNNEENDLEKIKTVLSFVGMEKYLNRKINTLSGGQQQRIGIARAIINDAKIILADEPTGHLDDKNTHQIMELFKKISKKALVILVTHEKSIAKKYANRIIELIDGKVLDDYENKLKNEGETPVFNIKHSNKAKKRIKYEPLKYVFKFNKSRIISIVLFIFSSIFISLSMSFSIFQHEEDNNINNYIDYPINSVYIDRGRTLSEREYLDILNIKGIKGFQTAHMGVPFELFPPSLLQDNSTTSIVLYYLPCPIYEAKEIIFGKAPSNPYEILIDEFLCNRLLNLPSNRVESAKHFGFLSPANFINSRITFNNQFSFKIVGVSKSYAPCFYLNESELYSLCLTRELSAPIIYDNLNIIKKDIELKGNEVIMNINSYINGNYKEKRDEVEILGKIYKIVDTYESNSINAIFMDLYNMKELFWSNYLKVTYYHYAFCDNPEIIREILIKKGYNSLTSEEYAKLHYREVNQQSQNVSNTFAIIIIIASAFVYLLSEKRRINEMVPEISIRRLLGQSKNNIALHLLLESFLTVLIFAIPFYLLSSFVINGTAVSIGSIVSIKQIPIGKLFLGMGILLVISLIITFIISIPILRKTPAELNKAKE